MVKPLYSIVVLVCHREPEIVETAKNCIASIKNLSHDYELIVVDNGSTLDTSWIEADTIVRFDTNRGIAHAWNTGMRLARADNVVVCNDDIIVCEGWLEKMRKALDIPRSGASNLHIEHLPGGQGVVENYKWFSGACFMLPKTTIEKIGYFDEQFYPSNFEDVDYWTRLKGYGLTMVVDYSATIQHKEGQTIHKNKEMNEKFMSNKQRYLDKWGFDPIPVFYHDQRWEDVESQVRKRLAQ